MYGTAIGQRDGQERPHTRSEDRRGGVFFTLGTKVRRKPFCPFALFARGCGASRTGLAQPSPRMRHPRSLPCAVHTSTRVQSTLDTHAPRVHASPAMHMLSRGNTRSRQKLGCCRARVTGHWPTVGRPAAGTSGSHTRCKPARHLRCVRFPCIDDMLCMPSTSTVAQHRTAET